MSADIGHVAVTGDIVLDCHLYGGVKTAATSFAEPGTVFTESLGGAALTQRLLAAAAKAAADLQWDKSLDKWRKENDKRRQGGQPPLRRPSRPGVAYEAHLDLETRGARNRIPSNLHSYGVWRPQPGAKDAEDQVWRVEPAFGYGPTEKKPGGFPFTRRRPPLEQSPALTVIDDGGILFRHGPARPAWPDTKQKGAGFYLLKMSWPLCAGDLWAELQDVLDRLIVVVSAGDLRRADIEINGRLSWELCAEQTLEALQRDPLAAQLAQAAHVVVSYGSAGALWATRTPGCKELTAHLIFDPGEMEGEHARKIDGTSYGFQTCFTVGIAHHLMQRHQESLTNADSKSPFADVGAMRRAMPEGITAGLAARRRLLELGHGPIADTPPGLPVAELGKAIATPPKGAMVVPMPDAACPAPPDCPWTILTHLQRPRGDAEIVEAPLIGLGQLTARYGQQALSDMPCLHLGALFTVDRSEIESLRSLQILIREYEDQKVQEKPLCIGVFGPPGAGKSFAVKALARAVLGKDVPLLNFNLSQFSGPEELIGAFHRVRDAVLKGTTPVAFWDEFDSREYEWLQYLLAPMQDGEFQEGQIIHPLGKCIFVFAGGTADTLERFGVEQPKPPTAQKLAALEPLDRQDRRRQYEQEQDRYRSYRLAKGPDFVSRLHGFLNVLGPNQQEEPGCHDITWPIRRALVLRSVLGLVGDQANAELDIDSGLLYALLGVSKYHHGSRSFEKIIKAIESGCGGGCLHRSALPARPLLNRETDAEEFCRLLTERDAFKRHPDLEDLARRLHRSFISDAERRKKTRGPKSAAAVDATVRKDYEALSPDLRASNRAAARRIPDHLALIDFVLEPLTARDSQENWQVLLAEAIEQQLERLARAEHLGWCSERRASGWSYAEKRDNGLKHHPLLVEWAELPLAERAKDEDMVRAIPQLLADVGYKALLLKTKRRPARRRAAAGKARATRARPATVPGP